MRRAPLALLPVAAAGLLVAVFLTGGVTDEKSAVEPGTPVSRPFVVDETTVESCGENIPCLEQALGNLAALAGPEVAWSELERLTASGQFRPTACHLATHRIGAGTMLWSGGSIEVVLANYRPNCADGYIHGAMDDLLSDLDARDAAGMAARVDEACGDPGDWPNIFEQSNCAHGAGHAMMLHSGYDLPLALDACRDALEREELGDEHPVYLGCVNGAFMENYNPSYDVAGRWLDYDDPYATCDEIELGELEELSCWIHATYALRTTYLVERGDDVAGFAAACDRLEQPMALNRCYLGLGRELGMFGSDPAFVAKSCALGRPLDGERACIFQSAYQQIFLLRGTTDDPARGVRELCGLLAGRPVAADCWRGIGHAAYTDPSHEDPGSPLERCRALRVPEGIPLELCVRQASGEPYFPGSQYQ